MSELASLQRAVRRLVSSPEEAPAGAVAALLRDGGGVPPAKRLAVYANAYFARLHDALREDFGALACALGDAAFHDLVTTYLMRHPPGRPSLRDAGAHLAEHLATEPFSAIFARQCPYAADLARLEWALVEAFDAADAPALDAGALATVAPEDWPGLRFATTPSLRLVACAHPVYLARERFDAGAGGEAAALAPAPTAIAVWRRHEQVRYRALPDDEADALAAAYAGASFGEICDRLVARAGDGAAARAAELLAGWLAAELVAGLR